MIIWNLNIYWYLTSIFLYFHFVISTKPTSCLIVACATTYNSCQSPVHHPDHSTVSLLPYDGDQQRDNHGDSLSYMLNRLKGQSLPLEITHQLEQKHKQRFIKQNF